MIPGLSRNAVVAASAGTGKTELLTSIYLGHCLGLAGDGAIVSPPASSPPRSPAQPRGRFESAWRSALQASRGATTPSTSYD